jgi:tetratricopeptide (TPR) repeat protein
MSSDRSVSTLTSSSPQAYKLYLSGLDKFGKELYDDAIADLEKAVAIDTNFALAYLRIGMAYQFMGRPQQGKQYIALANEKRENLPVREKNVVDIYSNVWLYENFDEAFVKIKTFVSNYPQDKELRTIYALFLDLFVRDTVQTFAHFDTVLKIDPQYQLAISQYANRCLQNGNYEKAMTLVDQLLTFHPDSPTGYRMKTSLYVRDGRYDDAIQMQMKLLEIFPDDADAFEQLSDLHIQNREFDKAKLWAERMKEKYSDDPYRMFNYYLSLANLENWNGRFLRSNEYRFQALNEILKTEDSAYITAAYDAISTQLFRMGFADSSMHYARKGFKWAPDMQKLNFPLTIVSRFPHMADIVRPVFGKAVESFKARIPSEYWDLTDAVSKIFNARCDADTAMIIEGLKKMATLQPQSGINQRRAMAYLMVETGRFDEGLGLLQEIHADHTQSLNAYRYNTDAYYLGRAHEGLGHQQEAIEQYEGVLRYWGSPDLEIDRVEDSRSRLVKLTT